jgi:hypothetical protein
LLISASIFFQLRYKGSVFVYSRIRFLFTHLLVWKSFESFFPSSLRSHLRPRLWSHLHGVAFRSPGWHCSRQSIILLQCF